MQKKGAETRLGTSETKRRIKAPLSYERCIASDDLRLKEKIGDETSPRRRTR
jgi:hypothetical protein